MEVQQCPRALEPQRAVQPPIPMQQSSRLTAAVVVGREQVSRTAMAALPSATLSLWNCNYPVTDSLQVPQNRFSEAQR